MVQCIHCSREPSANTQWRGVWLCILWILPSCGALQASYLKIASFSIAVQWWWVVVFLNGNGNGNDQNQVNSNKEWYYRNFETLQTVFLSMKRSCSFALLIIKILFDSRGWLRKWFENIVLYDKTGAGDGTKVTISTSALMQHMSELSWKDSNWKQSIQHFISNTCKVSFDVILAFKAKIYN